MRLNPKLILAVLVSLAFLAACEGEIDKRDSTTASESEPPSAGLGPSLMISVAGATVQEGNLGQTVVPIEVTLSRRGADQVVVDFATRDLTAKVGTDYLLAKGSLLFKPGEVSKSIDVVVAGDTTDEQDEHFVLQVFSADAVVLAPEVTITIVDDDDPVSGLLSRPSNPLCVAPDAPATSTSVSQTRVFNSVGAFSRPISMVQAPGDPSQWYLAEQDGMVYRFDNVAAPSGRSTVIDLTATVDSSYGESGLLGIAFHPDFSTNGYMYVSYTASGPGGSFPLTSTLSRFHSSDGGQTLDTASEVVILSIDQPDDSHNGGHIAFGPDGFLYLALGDGGGDPATNGVRSQNTENLFGSVLRLDVDGGSPYAIPADNPFAGNPVCSPSVGGIDANEACPEIFAWGFRNPWRFSFDRETGQMWLGDVGQNSYEEVNIVERGGNYGWNVLEGNACFEPSVGCDTAGLVPPIVTYDHNVGFSITGGFVYRGSDIPELVGRYVFVDFVTRVLFATQENGVGGYDYEELINPSVGVSSMAEDADGELFMLRYGKGYIHKIIQSGGTTTNTVPDSLVDTGCVDPGSPQTPVSGMIPYDPIASFWSDGATKERYYAIPDGTTIDVDASGDWLFPVGAVTMKHFRLAGKIVETRLYMRHTDGEWGGYSYEWNDAETEALRVVGGKARIVEGQTWKYPSEGQCFACHTEAASSSLGPENLSLNKNLYYPSSGLTGNQLTTADAVDLLTDPLLDAADNLQRIVDPGDTGFSLDERARSYLHVNCAGCHRPQGPTPTNIDLRYTTPLAATSTCDATPGSGDLGIADALIIAPGDADRSVLINRVARRDANAMPPLASELVDASGVALLTEWVNTMGACP